MAEESSILEAASVQIDPSSWYPDRDCLINEAFQGQVKSKFTAIQQSVDVTLTAP